MDKIKKVAMVFPGQGAQYPGMGKDFADSSQTAREIFEEADDVLGRKLSTIIFNGPEDKLTETRNSQIAIFVSSVAALRVLQKQYPTLQPAFAAGLSLGEYTALHAANYITFNDALPLVQHRGQFMNDACEKNKGAMAVVLGLSQQAVEEIIAALNMPDDLWAANFNCPGQVVISGTQKGIEAGSQAAKEAGAKRVVPLQVHGAFHSGLMREAEERLKPYIDEVPLKKGAAGLIMNVTGKLTEDQHAIKENLIRQVTHSVRWEECMHELERFSVDLFLEIGPGKTLAAFNKRIGMIAPTISIEKIEDLEKLSRYTFETVVKGEVNA